LLAKTAQKIELVEGGRKEGSKGEKRSSRIEKSGEGGYCGRE